MQTVATQTTLIDACTQTNLTGDNLYSCCNKGTDTEDLPELKMNASKQESPMDMLQGFLPKFAQCLLELLSLNLSNESPASRKKLIHSCFRNNLLSEKKLAVATEISGNIHPGIIIDIDLLTPGVLSDNSSESSSPHGLQILQQGTSGQRNKKIAKV